jgi:D-beta-D-heptose 7-phosphate kinase/D-beta-D-heptose 1-phosphate adenosyltransferase
MNEKATKPWILAGLLICLLAGAASAALQKASQKGRAFMPEFERLEIISGVRGVDHVVTWDDGSQFVSGCIDILKPIAFTKGGDRTDATNVPEFDLCKRIGCEVIFNVGGGKIQSSSDLIAGARQK